ncbi:hypothetical protein K8R04_01920 [Candidatus Uhrbacteria bacterium]|nr:hypothetical protein [Candidatus Uhrbacteria bacterium]
MNVHKIFCVFATVALLGTGCTKTLPTVLESTQYGVSLTPEAFDGPSFERFMAMVPEAGGVLSWAGEGMELAKEKSAASVVIGLSKQRTWAPVIVAGAKASILTDKLKRTILQDAIVDFARREQPPYLGVGNEINFSYTSGVDRIAMVDFFKETYRKIKEASPKTRVFPIFQLEWMKGLKGGLFGGEDDLASAEWDLIGRFPDADLVAFTTYPALAFKSPSDIPVDYYSEIAKHTNKPVAFTEIGWFRVGPKAAGWESSPEEQAEFVKRIPPLIESTKPTFVIWPFLFDQAIGPPFEHMGLLPPTSSTTPGWEAWKGIAQPSLDNSDEQR